MKTLISLSVAVLLVGCLVLTQAAADTPLEPDAQLQGLYPIERDILDALGAGAPELASRLRERLPDITNFEEREALLQHEMQRAFSHQLDLVRSGLSSEARLLSLIIWSRRLVSRISVFYGKSDGTKPMETFMAVRPVGGTPFDPTTLSPYGKFILGIRLSDEEMRQSNLHNMTIAEKLRELVPLTPEETERYLDPQEGQDGEKSDNLRDLDEKPDAEDKPDPNTRPTPETQQSGLPRGESLWEQTAHLFGGFKLTFSIEGDHVVGTLAELPAFGDEAESAIAQDVWGLQVGRVFFEGTVAGTTVTGLTRFGLLWMNKPECVDLRDRAETDRTHWSPFELELNEDVLSGGYERQTLLTGPLGACDVVKREQVNDQFRLIRVHDESSVVSIVFTQAEAPYEKIESLTLGGEYMVEVTFDRDPELDTYPVTLANPQTGATLEAEALRTDDPVVYRTEPLQILPQTTP